MNHAASIPSVTKVARKLRWTLCQFSKRRGGLNIWLAVARFLFPLLYDLDIGAMTTNSEAVR